MKSIDTDTVKIRPNIFPNTRGAIKYYKFSIRFPKTRNIDYNKKNCFSLFLNQTIYVYS